MTERSWAEVLDDHGTVSLQETILKGSNNLDENRCWLKRGIESRTGEEQLGDDRQCVSRLHLWFANALLMALVGVCP